MKTRLIAALAAVLLLASCMSIEDARKAKDLEAEVLLAAACAAGRGATNRMFDDEPAKLAALDLLCDGRDPGRQAPVLDAATLDVLSVIFGARTPASPPDPGAAP